MNSRDLRNVNVICIPTGTQRAFQVELEFGNVGFCGGRKTGVREEKPSEHENQQQTQRSLGIEPRPHWWEANAPLPLRHPCSLKKRLFTKLSKFPRTDWLIGIAKKCPIKAQTIKMTSDVTRALFQRKIKPMSPVLVPRYYKKQIVKPHAVHLSFEHFTTSFYGL